MADSPDHVSSQPKPEGSPNEIFHRMVVNDKKQNQRLINKFLSGAGRYDLNQQAMKNNNQVKDDSTRVTWIRFLVCTLGLTSLAMGQMSRMVLNQTITMMVDPRMLKNDVVSVDGSCPWPEEESLAVKGVEKPIDQAAAATTTTTTTTTSTTTSLPLNLTDLTTNLNWLWATDSEDNNNDKEHEDDLINSESISTSIKSTSNMTSNHSDDGGKEKKKDEENKQQLNNGNSAVVGQEEAIYADKFKWSISKQSVLLGGFYYSYFFFMILGGRMAEVYGAKYVLLICVAGSAVINLATPWMARNSFVLLVVSRILMGIVQAGVFPAMYALIAKWLTMSEASIFAPLIKMNLRLGMLLGSLLPGILPGWPSVYYTTGVLSFLWSVLWIFIATSTPQENKWVSQAELEHIMKKKRRPEQIEMSAYQESQTSSEQSLDKTSSAAASAAAANKPTPWVKILTSPSVIGLIIVKLTFNYALDFLAILLPSYLKYVHHASKGQLSQITTIMFGIQVILVVFVGWFAKSMVKRRPFGLSKTAIRRLFQGVSSLGMALFLFILTFNDCNLLFVGILLQIVSFLSMFTAGGETMLPYDLSDEYPATIMAIANSVANLSGVTSTVLASFILGDQGGSYDRWNLLMRLVAGANLFGGLAFAFLVKAEPIDFGPKKKRDDIEQAPTNGSEKSNTFSGITLGSVEKEAAAASADTVGTEVEGSVALANTKDQCQQPEREEENQGGHDATALKQHDDDDDDDDGDDAKEEQNSKSKQEQH